MFNLPFSQSLDQAQNILIAGAGGGYDVFSGLPLYFALREQGKNVFLANLSFTILDLFRGEMLSPTMMKVLPSTEAIPRAYFPEWHLTRWFQETRQEEIPIFAFSKTGVAPLLKNYQQLVSQYNIDTIILADGGTDSLMRGDEDRLGTPAEDLTSITAVSRLDPADVPRKLLVCLGFGVDHYHGVSNDLTLSAIAEMTQTKTFLGSLSLLDQMPEVQAYRSAAQFTFDAMPDHISIVSSSILSALVGHYGDHHATKRTHGSKLWINPLMAIYWFFDLHGLAQRNILIDYLRETESFMDVAQTIVRTRQLAIPHIKTRSFLPD